MAEQHQGLNLERDPRNHPTLTGSPPEQSQEWPGSDEQLNPQADHGEKSYRGGGKLEGLKALITGGDSGIGRAVAIAFAREGADVAISYFDEHEDAQETKSWVDKAGRRCITIAGDLQKHDHCKEVVRRTIEELGGLNILVNNAAFHIETSDFREIPPEQLERTFRTNFFAYVWMAQEACRHMQAGDTIINTGSVVGYMPYPHLTDYAATKAAIHNFTKNAAGTLVKDGIRVNCVAPGPVWTPLIAATRDEQFVGKFGQNSYWKRPAQPAEIAPSFVFLASSDSRYYTGEIFSPSGFSSTTR